MTTAGAARPMVSGAANAVLGVVLVLVLWELAARALAGAWLLAGPSEVAGYLVSHAGLMGRALAATLANAAWGFLWGNLAAICLALIATAWPRSEGGVSGIALLVFCLPLVATGPLLRVVFGPGNGPQVTLSALAVYYTTYTALMVGLRAAPASWLDLIRSYGRGRLSELVHVRSMAALPYLFAGLQIAAPAAFLGAMVGEFTGAERGMGVLTIRAMRALDVPGTWALAVLAAGASMAVYSAIGLIARATTREAPPVILAPPVHPGGRRSAWLTGPLLLAMLVLLTWWGTMEAAGLSPFFAKRPGDVFAALFLDADAAELRAGLARALGETAVFVLPGYLAGLAVGSALAVLVTLIPAVAAVAMPLAVTLRAVPVVTTAPLVVLLLGRGATGTIALVALMVFFPTFVACLAGLARAPGQVMDVFRSLGAGRLMRLIHVRLPAMLPAFCAAARMAVPASVLAVTVVEWLATGRGIGSYMALAASLSDYDALWSAVVVVAILSVLVYALVARLERAALRRWAPEQVAR